METKATSNITVMSSEDLQLFEIILSRIAYRCKGVALHYTWKDKFGDEHRGEKKVHHKTFDAMKNRIKRKNELPTQEQVAFYAPYAYNEFQAVLLAYFGIGVNAAWKGVTIHECY